MGITHSPDNHWNRIVPSVITENSPYDKITRNLGQILKKTITLAQGAEPIHMNLFSFTGPFRLSQLYGVCTRVGAGGSADCDDAWFNLYDGTNTVAISLGGTANGLDMSNITVSSVIYRDGAVGVVLSYMKADEVRIKDAAWAGSELWQESLVAPKTGITNYIRFTYDSDPASGIDFDMQMFIVYSELDYETPSGLAVV